MNQGNNLATNVSWQMWNMHKRVSSAQYIAKIANGIRESCRQSAYWNDDDLADVERLTDELDACAARGKETLTKLWELKKVPSTSEATNGDGAVTPDGPSVLEQLFDIFHAGRVTEYWDWCDELKRRLCSVETARNDQRQRAIDGAIERRRAARNLLRRKGSRELLAVSESEAFRSLDRHDAQRRVQLEELARLATEVKVPVAQARTMNRVSQRFITNIDREQGATTLWISEEIDDPMRLIRATERVVEDLEEIDQRMASLIDAISAG